MPRPKLVVDNERRNWTARELWAKKGARPGRKPTLTRDEWLVIGEALAEGKQASKGQPGGFKAWRRAEGFGEMRAADVSCSIWMLSPEAQNFLSIMERNHGPEHPKAIHAAYRAQRSADLGMSHVAAILKALKAGPKTAQELAAATGLDSVQVIRRTAELARAGKIKRDGTKYRLVEGRTAVEAVQAEAEKKLADDLHRAVRALESAVENLCEHSKDANDARLRMAMAIQSPWAAMTVGVTETVENGKAVRRKTDNIFPGMDPEGVSEGRYGRVKSMVRIEIIEP